MTGGASMTASLVVSVLVLVVPLLGLSPGPTVLLVGLVLAGAVVQHVRGGRPQSETPRKATAAA